VAFESTLTGDGRPQVTSGRRWLVARAVVVVAIATALGLYILAQYAEHIGKIVTKVAPEHSPVMLVVTIGAALPASAFMLLLAFLVELLWGGWERSSLRKIVTGNRNSLHDFTYTVFALLPVQLVAKVILTFGVIWLSDKIIAPRISWNLVAYMPWWPLQYLAVVLIGSFFQYWQHRILHMVPVLWQTHKLHHSALEMNLLNLHRESPFTTGVADLLIFAPLAIFGVNEAFKRGGQLGIADLAFMALFMSYSIFNVLNHYLIHSELRTTYGWFGRWIFISPLAHRVHHSKLPQYWDKNFSVSLVLWDRVFGTWVEGDNAEARSTPLGFKDNLYNQQNPLIDYFWFPLRDFGRACAQLARGELEFIRRGP
jgi:sterol desaturase/sphingolipid hydroxylase (fatty acid hydroxylase superfamily)